ncbi:hypothetical protein GCM10022402_37080 [Salinactinospora qingdaonensis]|uniref:Uncharacterized protein n=1 Tax=Salinactinospora qingdaonensis TaxID=702744 RepID=A0ABP7G3V9_9ACTN
MNNVLCNTTRRNAGGPGLGNSREARGDTESGERGRDASDTESTWLSDGPSAVSWGWLSDRSEIPTAAIWIQPPRQIRDFAENKATEKQ